jgi:hypothetical protein
MYKRIFTSLLLLIAILSGRAFAQENEIDFSSLSYIDGKIYLSSDQLTFSEKEIFVLLPDINGLYAKVCVYQINCDANGLFVLIEHISPQLAQGWCAYGHKSVCDDCGGCAKPKCPRICKCRR